MSDIQEEIKEILDKLRETADYPKINYSSYDKSYNETIDNVAMIKSFACKQLLDYITNLQEENIKLKELCDKYEEEHSTTFEEWKKDINIIDKLEKWLIDNIEYGDDDYYDMKAMGVESALNKLKELKGDNK